MECPHCHKPMMIAHINIKGHKVLWKCRDCGHTYVEEKKDGKN